ncbi:MAG: hypothetical protein OXF88_10610, partial [Rhodobacteraceae bacterium]|nr:hypothetical protein [Paracoccaceae bacterium]
MTGDAVSLPPVARRLLRLYPPGHTGTRNESNGVASYSINDPEALERALVKVIKGWVFNQQVTCYSLNRVHGLASSASRIR